MKKKNLKQSMLSGIIASVMLLTSALSPVIVSAYVVDHPQMPDNISGSEFRETGRLQWTGDGGYIPLDYEAFFDFPVRDTYITYVQDDVVGGGYYYMVGTTGSPTWWSSNEGVRMWRSSDLKEWQDLGIVWRIEDSVWAYDHALWAPEVHYIDKYDNYYITYSLSNDDGNGILKSSTGRPEGPYVEMTENEIVGPERKNIDGSLFEDDDGKVYFLWQDGLIAEVSLMDEQGNDEFRYLTDPVLIGIPESEYAPYLKSGLTGYEIEHVGFEGAYLIKIDGRYYLSCAEFNTNGGVQTYDCMVASSDNIMGPYENFHLAVRSGGHNMFFFDREGQLWSTFFGNDGWAPISERPGIVKMQVTDDGRLQPLMSNGEVNLAQMDGATVSAPTIYSDTYAAEMAVDGCLSTRWAAKKNQTAEGVMVDFGKPCVVSGVRTYFEFAKWKYDYTIETSMDGVTWDSYAVRTGDNTVTGAPIDRGNGLVKAQYVRITVNSSNTSATFHSSLREFQVYGWEDGITSQQVADVLPETKEITYDGTRIVLPELPEGFTAEIKSVSVDGVIASDGSVTLPANTTDVEVILTITGNGESADTEPMIVTLPSAQENLATGKTIAATSTYSDSYSPEMALDGDYETRWAASTGEKPESVVIDLDGIYDLNSVETEFEMSGRYLMYYIETSVDQENWQMFADRRDNDHPETTWVDTVEEPATARYVRITVTDAQHNRSTPDYASIREIRVYGTENTELVDKNDLKNALTAEKEAALYENDYTEKTWETYQLALEAAEALLADESATQDAVDAAAKVLADAKTGLEKIENRDFPMFTDNLALNKPAEADEIYSSSYDAAKAVDGIANTRWCVKGWTENHWLTVDLEDTYYISEIITKFEMASDFRFRLLYSVDGENWSVFADKTADATKAADYTYTGEGYGRYVKFEFLTSTNNAWCSIWELEVYGSKLKEVAPLQVTGYVDTEIKLPKTVDVTFEDGQIMNVDVTWAEDTQTVYEAEGQYTISGVISNLEGDVPVTASVEITVPPVDKSELEAAVAAEKDAALVEADYTEVSWKAYAEALAAAQALLDAEEVTDQEAVNAAVTTLAEAKAGLVELADLTALKAAVDAEKEAAFVEEDYTEASWKAYAEALAAAEALLDAEEVTDQEAVDAAVAALTEAKAGLEEAPVIVDKGENIALTATASGSFVSSWMSLQYAGINDGTDTIPDGGNGNDYAWATWGNMGDSEYIQYNWANVVEISGADLYIWDDNPNDLYTGVDTPAKLVYEYLPDGSDEWVELAVVEEGIVGGAAGEINEITFAEPVKAAALRVTLMKNLQEGVTEAQEGVGATEWKVYGTDTGVAVTVPVDKSALEAAVAAEKEAALVNADYTEDTWKAYAEALEAAEALLDDAEATQETVDAAVAALADTKAALEKVPVVIPVDKAALQAAVDAAEALKAEDYTEKTWEAYQSVLVEAKAVLADEEATQSAVDEAADTLVAAADLLRFVLPYVDVAETDWFYESVYYNYFAKTMTGMDDTHFGPYESLSRAQFALILYRIEGEPEVQTEKSFLDISGDEWYGQAVLWAAEAGIVTGYENGCYGPVDMITREQMAVMMYRYAKYLEKDITKTGNISEFLDASSVSPFATEAFAWANGMGIITGKENGTMLAPQANTARAEAAAIIERYMSAYAE